MNRRAFLLGAIAAPVAAPVIAKAAAPTVIGVDLAGAESVTAVSTMVLGEMRPFMEVFSAVDGAKARWVYFWAGDQVRAEQTTEVDVSFPSLRHPDT